MKTFFFFDVPPLTCVQIFGLEALLGSAKLWPLLLALTVAPAVVQCILLPFCPESPRFLLINLKQEEQARKGMLPGCFSSPLRLPLRLPSCLLLPLQGRPGGERFTARRFWQLFVTQALKD